LPVCVCGTLLFSRIASAAASYTLSLHDALPILTLVASAGPPKIPVPDVTGLDGTLAQRLMVAAGLTVAQVESVQAATPTGIAMRSEEHTSELQSPYDLVCRLLLVKKKT